MKEQNKSDPYSILPELKEPKNMIIIGHNSMIASRFLELTGESRVVGYDHQKAKAPLRFPTGRLNVLTASIDEIKNLFKEHPGEYVINFVAQTNVDSAEEEGDKDNPEGVTFKLNVEVVKKLAAVAKEFNITLVHLSTDFVFDGKSGPYSEEDKPAVSRKEVGWYGWTKKLAESEIARSGVRYLIVRTAYPYRANFEGKSDFVRNILEKLESKNLYPMHQNQLLTPTFIDNFAKALGLLISENKNGIWHIADNTTLSAFAAAQSIVRVFGFDVDLVRPGDLNEWQSQNPDKAKRPINGGLKNDKLQKFLTPFGFKMTDFETSLLELKRQMSL